MSFFHIGTETFDAGTKGRGVRAKIDIEKGQTVIIEHPIAVGESNSEESKRMLWSIGEEKINDSASNLICETITCRARRERLLKQT